MQNVKGNVTSNFPECSVFCTIKKKKLDNFLAQRKSNQFALTEVLFCVCMCVCVCVWGGGG